MVRTLVRLASREVLCHNCFGWHPDYRCVCDEVDTPPGATPLSIVCVVCNGEVLPYRDCDVCFGLGELWCPSVPLMYTRIGVDQEALDKNVTPMVVVDRSAVIVARQLAMDVLKETHFALTIPVAA